MKMPNAKSSLLLQFDKSQAKLSQVVRLEQIKKQNYKEELRQMYEMGGEYRVLATLLNAVLAQWRLVFILSKKILEDLIKRDPNQEYKSLDSKTYTKFLKKFLDSFAECLRQPTPFRDPKTGKLTPKSEVKAGVYEIKVDQLRAYILGQIGQEAYERQLKVALEAYDKRPVPSEPDNSITTDKAYLQRITYELWEALTNHYQENSAFNSAACGANNPPKLIEEALLLLESGAIIEINERNGNFWRLKLLKHFPSSPQAALAVIDNLLGSFSGAPNKAQNTQSEEESFNSCESEESEQVGL